MCGDEMICQGCLQTSKPKFNIFMHYYKFFMLTTYAYFASGDRYSYNVCYCIQDNDVDQDSSSNSEQNGRLIAVIKIIALVRSICFLFQVYS